MAKKILLSGIQPSGKIHLGNYLGTLKNWVDMQSKHSCLYSVVDLHAITGNYDPKKYQEDIFNTVVNLLAIGINPKKSIIFVQSSVKEHTELCWLFNSITPIAELERMTQFKDKASKNKQNINVGLFNYPVLQAADILLYRAEVVPVGEDQLQHLELTNTILRKFNNKFGNTFNEIKPILSKGARIMSLADPASKMSKSLGSKHYIALSDSPEEIKKKIMSAVTDTSESKEMSAGVKNLFTLLELLADKKIYNKYLNEYNNKSLKYSELKSELADVIINLLKPIQEKREYWLQNRKKVNKIILNGNKKARLIAQKNIIDIKQKMGLL